MRVQGKYIKLFDTNKADGEESTIGTVQRISKGRWCFNPADDWMQSADQMQCVARLLDALEDCDRDA